MELLIDLEAQLPTRRFFNTLLDDHAVIVTCRLAPFMRRENKDVGLLKELFANLDFYSKFEINDLTGLALTDLDMTETRGSQLTQLQVLEGGNTKNPSSWDSLLFISYSTLSFVALRRFSPSYLWPIMDLLNNDKTCYGILNLQTLNH